VLCTQPGTRSALGWERLDALNVSKQATPSDTIKEI
jgi:hypothetical protein